MASRGLPPPDGIRDAPAASRPPRSCSPNLRRDSTPATSPFSMYVGPKPATDVPREIWTWVAPHVVNSALAHRAPALHTSCVLHEHRTSCRSQPGGNLFCSRPRGIQHVETARGLFHSRLPCIHRCAAARVGKRAARQKDAKAQHSAPAKRRGRCRRRSHCIFRRRIYCGSIGSRARGILLVLGCVNMG